MVYLCVGMDGWMDGAQDAFTLRVKGRDLSWMNAFIPTPIPFLLASFNGGKLGGRDGEYSAECSSSIHT
jgi:hypothetical protein